MIEKILRFSIYHPLEILILTLAIAGLGIWSFSRLPIDAVPDITNNQVQINTSLPGFSPEQIEKQVTYVIETSLAGIPGLEMTRSISRNAFSQVTAIFDDKVNIYFARQQINERLSALLPNLPDGAEPHMGPISTGLGEIYMWTVSYDCQHSENGKPGCQADGSYITPEGDVLKTVAEKASYLRTLQDWVVKPQMKNIQGLAEVDSIGGFVRQYHVEPNLEKMIALGLSFEDLVNALKRNNASIGPGYIEKGGESFLVTSDERLSSPKQIETIVVASQNGIPTRVKDIANVVIGKEMRTGSASKDGDEVVVGTAMMLIGANSRTVAQAVDTRLNAIIKSMPPGIKIETVVNRTKLVNATITTVAKNLGEGAILVIAVLFLFLRQFRAALITAAVIPLAMVMTAIGMVESNISGNLMSLGAIDFGLIVDGAVIITENCLRRIGLREKEQGGNLNLNERREEVLSASKEMIQPTVFGQAIIMTVYIPILTLSGVEGKMFHPMAFTVLYALIAAFILSLTFVPSMIGYFVSSHVESENHFIDKIKDGYKTYLDKALESSWQTILGGAFIVLLSMLMFYQLGQEFVPTLDEKDIAMHAIRIPSTSLTQSTEMQSKVEKAIKGLPEVDYVFSKTGTAEEATDPMPPNVSDTFIMLKPQDQWPNPAMSKVQLIDSIEKTVRALPGNNYEFTQPIEMRFNELISGVRSDVAVQVYGDDFAKMQSVAEKIYAVLKKIPGAADVKVAQTSGLPVLDVKIDREAASRLGLNVADGLDVLAIASGGGKAGQVFEGDRRFDIIVKLPDEVRENIRSLENLPVPLKKTDSGHFPHVPFGEIAKIKITEGFNEIQRENGKRFIGVEANVRGRDLGSFVDQAKREINKSVAIPDGYWLEWGGQFENLLSARNTLMLVVPICLALILGLLYAALRNVKDSLLVFTGVPLALTGGILLLWLRDIPFSISAAVGFIALSGIAVLNGLVLISSINQLRDQGMGLGDAIRQGTLQRLRPVLMTALVASLGFVPMALASGTGAEVQKPLATVVIGGLISSTLLTLFILPALYAVFTGKKWTAWTTGTA